MIGVKHKLWARGGGGRGDKMRGYEYDEENPNNMKFQKSCGRNATLDIIVSTNIVPQCTCNIS